MEIPKQWITFKGKETEFSIQIMNTGLMPKISWRKLFLA